MSQSTEDRIYEDALFTEYCGDRVAALSPQRRRTAHDLFCDVMWHEGIEALTPERLDCILDFAAETLPDAA
ncbi:hypothetical protein [Azospirillum canadense]|uniref:hypothetical protein n=1 Tax=Azospirillum canadense TaxID=403962 RepID=UPI002225CBB0|nr:hypothetical protein [Azospirillum canadense]MCW2243293.1 hypothetical protein [Azospirillum canadense]